MMMASTFKIEELKLSQDESKKIAEAIANVSSHYDVAIDPKIMAWVNLTMVLSSVYAPRFMAYKLRVNLEAKKKAEINTPENNLQMPKEFI